MRGCVHGAWRWLVDHDHLPATRGCPADVEALLESCFQGLDDKTVGPDLPVRVAGAWLAVQEGVTA